MSHGDLEALLRATAPGYGSAEGPDVDAVVGTAETPLGRLVLAMTERGLAVCSYDDEASAMERLSRLLNLRVGLNQRPLDPARRELDAYFTGRLRTFSIPVDLRLASSFARAVLQALPAAVPYGSTATYGEIAARMGRPRAPRAIGNALANNPVCVIVPCHRVIAGDGSLGGYSGGGGIEVKRQLLTLEAAAADRTA